MLLPDTSDVEKMAHIGRLSVLGKARHAAAMKLRDKLVPMLNSIEYPDKSWDVSGVVELVELIKALTIEIKMENEP